MKNTWNIIFIYLKYDCGSKTIIYKLNTIAVASLYILHTAIISIRKYLTVGSSSH